MTAAGRRQAGHLCRRPYFAEWPAPGKDQFLPTAGICRVPGSRQRLICRRPFFAGCLQAWHPAKNSFAGCPIKSTRQIFLLPANQPFPVVSDPHISKSYVCVIRTEGKNKNFRPRTMSMNRSHPHLKDHYNFPCLVTLISFFLVSKGEKTWTKSTINTKITKSGLWSNGEAYIHNNCIKGDNCKNDKNKVQISLASCIFLLTSYDRALVLHTSK